MADYSWPATLPDWSWEGLEEQPPDVAVRTEMDAGPPKVRRRHTTNARPFTGRVVLIKTEVATFDEFYVTTLKGGTLRFDYTNPRTGDTDDFLFAGVPKYRNIGPAQYEVAFNVFKMP